MTRRAGLVALACLVGVVSVSADQRRLRLVPTAFGATVTWTLQSQPTPRPSYNGFLSILYDPVSQQSIHYGIRSDHTGIYSTTTLAYASATNTWTQISTSGHATADCSDNGASLPEDRHPEQMAIDTSRNRLWMWSGVGCTIDMADLWYMSLNASPASNTWTEVSFSTTPDVHHAASMVYDPDVDVLVLFGPNGGNNPKVWLYCFGTSTAQTNAGCTSANDWKEISVVGGTYPPGVLYNGLFYDTVNDKVIAYGGEAGGSVPKNETWAYTVQTKTWTQKCGGGCSPPIVWTGSNYSHPPMAFIPSLGKLWYRQITNTGSPKDWFYDYAADTWTAATSNAGPAPTTVQTFYTTYDIAAAKLIAFVRKEVDGSADLWQGVVQ